SRTVPGWINSVQPMSAAPPVTLDFLGARVAQLTDEMRDVRQRFGIIEHRLDALEARFAGLEG
ncbi:MAG TPA: hypothetical protein VF742_04125, partial [Terracidiphilus sp.]